MSLNNRSDLWAWYVVASLAVLYVFSIVDRIIFVILADEISGSLGLSDAQMGLVLGIGFAIVYSLAGLPLAHWLDTRPRKAIVSAGVILWGAMTMLASLATDFATLLLCRSGLAFGEAVLTPAAVSLIGDMFAKERRTLPMSLYASVGGIFGTGAFAIGAFVVTLTGPIAVDVGIATWRMSLVVVGVPTILLGILFYLTVREPVRQVDSSQAASAGAAQFVRHLLDNRSFYFPFYAGFALICCFNYALVSWAPTIFLREHGLDPARSSLIFGVLGIAGGAIGSLLIPQATARIERRWPGRGITSTLVVLSLVLIPVAVLLPMSDRMVMLFGCAFFAVLFSSSWMVLGSLAFQFYAQSEMRARLMAIYLLASSLFGLSLGPILLVLFANFWPSSDRPLSNGLALLGLCTIPAAFVAQLMAHAGLRRIGSVRQ